MPRTRSASAIRSCPISSRRSSIRNLRLGKSHLDVRLHRYGRDVTVNVVSRAGLGARAAAEIVNCG